MHPILLTFAISMLSVQANAQPFVLEKSVDGDAYYAGQIKASGSYEQYEDGELCFVIHGASAKFIPYANQSARICFTNADEARTMLNLNTAVAAIDLKSVCGIKGRATLSISNLTTGVGPTRRWYSAKILQATKVARPFKVAC